MNKFETYLEMVKVKGMKVEKYKKPNKAYKDLIEAIRDSSDNMDTSLFDVNELMDALNDNYNFKLNQNKTIATHSSGIKFNINKVIEICKNTEDLYDIEASNLESAEVKN